jgi:hypothetical protein
MSRRGSFRQADATRAFRAAVAAGLKPNSCTIAPDGSIKLDFADEPARGSQNPVDRVLRQ